MDVYIYMDIYIHIYTYIHIIKININNNINIDINNVIHPTPRVMYPPSHPYEGQYRNYVKTLNMKRKKELRLEWLSKKI